MSVIGKTMQSLAQQFGRMYEVERMSGALPKVLLSATLAVSTAVAVSEAQAQQSQQRPVLPEQSAVRWGEVLGQTLGGVVGAAASKDVDNPGVGRVISGVISEVGRNVGGNTVRGAYSGTAASVPEAVRDQLDQAALRAAFAFEDYERTLVAWENGQVSRSQVNAAMDAFGRARDRFAGEIRVASGRGVSTAEWAPLKSELSRSRVDAGYVAQLVRPMAERLQRPGGPGYRAESRGASSLSDLRARVESRSVREYDAPRP